MRINEFRGEYTYKLNSITKRASLHKLSISLV